MSTPSARTGGSLDARFKISRAAAPCVRRLLQVLLPSGDGVLRHRGAGHARKSGLPTGRGVCLDLSGSGRWLAGDGIMGESADGDRLRYLVDRLHRLQPGAGAADQYSGSPRRSIPDGVLFTVIRQPAFAAGSCVTCRRAWRTVPDRHWPVPAADRRQRRWSGDQNPLDGLPVALGNFDSFPVVMSLIGLAVIIGLENEGAGRHSADHYRRVDCRPDFRSQRPFLRHFRYAIPERWPVIP